MRIWVIEQAVSFARFQPGRWEPGPSGLLAVKISISSLRFIEMAINSCNNNLKYLKRNHYSRVIIHIHMDSGESVCDLINGQTPYLWFNYWWHANPHILETVPHLCTSYDPNKRMRTKFKTLKKKLFPERVFLRGGDVLLMKVLLQYKILCRHIKY